MQIMTEIARIGNYVLTMIRKYDNIDIEREVNKMKVKNVIKGYCSKENIERLIIISLSNDDIGIFAGELKKYMNSTNIIMENYKKEVDEMEVIKSAVNCGCQLFIIVK